MNDGYATEFVKDLNIKFNNSTSSATALLEVDNKFPYVNNGYLNTSLIKPFSSFTLQPRSLITKSIIFTLPKGLNINNCDTLTIEVVTNNNKINKLEKKLSINKEIVYHKQMLNSNNECN